MTRDLLIQVDQAVVDVGLKLGQIITVLGEDVLEVDLDAVAEDDGVGDLHHGGLHVERHHQLLLCAVGHLSLKELTKLGGAQLGRINNLALLQLQVLLKHL